jgi:hypothetical protein
MQTRTKLRKGYKIKRKKLFKFETKSFTNVEICSIQHSQNVEKALVWHRRFGHVNFQTLREMSKELVLELPKLPHIEHVCDIC